MISHLQQFYCSDKMAEQITLTIGEAFDLAYERFLKRSGRELENQKLIIMLRKKVNELEAEVDRLRKQLANQPVFYDCMLPVPECQISDIQGAIATLAPHHSHSTCSRKLLRPGRSSGHFTYSSTAAE